LTTGILEAMRDYEKSNERKVFPAFHTITKAAKLGEASDSQEDLASVPNLKEIQFYIDGDTSTPMNPWDRCPRVRQIWDEFSSPDHIEDPSNWYFADLSRMWEAKGYTKRIQDDILGKKNDLSTVPKSQDDVDGATSHVAGLPFSSLASIGHLVDCLQAHICPTVDGTNKEIPDAFYGSVEDSVVGNGRGSTLLDEILWFSRSEYDIYWARPEIARLSGGLFAADILLAVDSVSSDYDFLLYSGHDDGPMAPLAGILVGQNYTAIERRPAYAGMMVMEVGETRVRWLLNGKVFKNEWCGGETGICDKAVLFAKMRAAIPSKEKCEKRIMKADPTTSDIIV